MSVASLLNTLRERGAQLELDGERLTCRVPKGALTPELSASMRERRDEIVAFLREAMEAAEFGEAPPIEPVPRAEYTPVSYSQERLWYLNQVDFNPAVYNLPLSVRLRGALRLDVLQRCLDALEARHEALRTTIVAVDGKPMQRFHAPRGLPLRVVEPPAGADQAWIDELLKNEAMNGFDIEHGPLARALIVRGAPDEHWFLLVMHHLIGDGISTQVMMRDIALMYEAFLRDEPARLPELPVQFADYAMWQRAWPSPAGMERVLAFWKARLGGGLEPLEVPGDHPRPPQMTSNGGKSRTHLSRELTAELTRIAREEGATRYMALFAVYAAFLHRFSGQTDFVIGTPVANRTRREVVDMVGFVANVLCIRVQMEGTWTYRELVRHVRDRCVEAFKRQDTPLQKVVEAVNPPRDMSRTPIFQVLLTYHEVTAQVTRMAEVEIEPIVVGSNVARQDQSLFLRELNGEIQGSMEYNSDLYRAETMDNMLAHFTELAKAVAAAPDASLSAFDVATDAERAHKARLSAAPTAVPDVPVHALVTGEAAHIAVRSAHRAISYAELAEQSGRVAHALIGAGVGVGDLVGICVERSVDMVVAMLGVMKAGAAYVPLDPEFPRSRLAYMLEDSHTRVVLVDASTAARLPETALDRIVLRVDELVRDDLLPGDAPRVNISGDDPAYVIYTSGSTGQPKAVEVPHRALVNFLCAMRVRPGMQASDVLVAVTTLSFDIAGLELLLPLMAGGTVVVASRETTLDGIALGALLEDTGATVMQGTPATWRMLLDGGWRGRPGLRALCGGEALPIELTRRLLPKVRELWNMYGPTETTIWSTCARVPDGSEPIDIGAPIANTVLRIVDATGREVPVGVTGELLIGGAGVARGYRGQPQLTESRFVTAPDGTRFYRTGDRVRLRWDGRLEHLGRDDDQVKVQGYRVELGEIEAVLAAAPSVREAVVSVSRGEDGSDARLVAYVVYEAGQHRTASELRQYLREHLPFYMVPGLISEIERVPRTPNGKIDRRALPDGLARAREAAIFAPPATPLERVVAETWAELLQVERVSRNDNFFELGGHSLLSMRAVAVIEQRTGARIDPRMMFFHTVEQIAARLEPKMVAAQ